MSEQITIAARFSGPEGTGNGGYVSGVVFLFTVAYVELLALLLPAWVTAVSIVILRTGPRGSRPLTRPGVP